MTQQVKNVFKCQNRSNIDFYQNQTAGDNVSKLRQFESNIIFNNLLNTVRPICKIYNKINDQKK